MRLPRTLLAVCGAMAAGGALATGGTAVTRLPFDEGTVTTVTQGYDAGRTTAPLDRRWVVGLTAPSGSTVVAVADGTVVEAPPATAATPFGQVIVAHPDGTFSYYIGLPVMAIAVGTGTPVKAGQKLGRAGGFLHFAMVERYPDGQMLSQRITFRNGLGATAKLVEPKPLTTFTVQYAPAEPPPAVPPPAVERPAATPAPGSAPAPAPAPTPAAAPAPAIPAPPLPVEPPPRPAAVAEPSRDVEPAVAAEPEPPKAASAGPSADQRPANPAVTGVASVIPGLLRTVFFVLGTVILIIYFWRRSRRRPAATHPLLHQLVGACAGDAAKAQRLLLHERQRNTALTEEQAIRAALERLARNGATD